MQKNLTVLILLSAIYLTSQAQKGETITVRAGARVLDYFPASVRYMYKEFSPGRVYFRNNFYSDRNLNYNYLLGEMEFIQGRDTLSIINKKDIKYISISQDTFYYDKTYIKQLKGGRIRIGLKDFIELEEILNKDPYGTSSSGAATTSYGSMPLDGNFYKLTANKDMVFRRNRQYYINPEGSGFVLINRKNLLQLFPVKENEIKSFLKTNKIKFDSREDILKLSDFLEGFNN